MGLKYLHTFGQLLLLSALTLLCDACPFSCECTNYKVNCYDKGLTEIPTDFPEDVISIDLQYNNIESIDDQFQNLTSVQEIMLRFNRISHIADGAFRDMPNLKHLNLGSNLITNLSRNTFQNVPQMSILDLTNNHLSTIDGSFEGLSTLTKVVLTRNHIEELSADSLKPLTNLVYFMADENRISHIHPAAFHSLQELSFVSMSKNPLTTMDNVLSSNTHLSYLNLEQCQLQNVPTGLPWATRNIQLLGNNITKISKNTFWQTRFLGIIVLDENNITEIQDGAFTPIAHLQELWLNGNRLTSLPAPIPATVHTVSMDNNEIAKVTHDNFPANSKLKRLSLRGNKINTISPYSFSRLASLEKLYLSSNDISQLQDKSFFGMRNLTTLEVGRNPITHIDVRFAAGLQKLDTLDLSYVDDTEPLVRGNFFRDIPFLKTLSLRSSPVLAHNILTSNETLKSFYNLNHLDVSDNNLQTLDFDLPRFFPSIKSILLARNAWICDPNLLWLHDWMQKQREAFVDVDDVVCAVPMHLAGAVIANLPYHAFFYTTVATTTIEPEAGSGEVDFENGTISDGTDEMTTTGTDKQISTVASVKTPTPSDSPETDAPAHKITTSVTDTAPVSTDTEALISTSSVKTSAMTTEVAAITKDSSITKILTTANAVTTTTTTNNPTSASKADTGTSSTSSSSDHETTTKAKTTLNTTSSMSSQKTSEISAQPEQTSETAAVYSTPNVNHHLTDTIPYGSSKEKTSDAHSFSLTHTIIIATSVAVVALIVLLAIVLILRNRRRIELIFHHTVGPKAQDSDTAFVLNDQDDPDTRSDSRQLTQMSESEAESTPSMENASDDDMCSRLV